MENETLGSWKQTCANAAYSYQMEFRKKGILSFGLSAGLAQRQLDGSKTRTPQTIFDTENNVVDHQDKLLTTGKMSGISPQFQAGVIYQGEKLEAGISAINLLESEIKMNTATFQPERTYFFYAGYKVSAGKTLSFHPSVLLKTDVQQTQMDFSFVAKYNENIFAGASFRGYRSESIDAVALIAGFKLSDKITTAYAYDLTLSNLKTVSNGSHEIVLNYNLGKPIGKGRPPKIIYNPRTL
jgi:type IX secretion system PorP/SprF family membrane protein